jgi:hypothetical protein
MRTLGFDFVSRETKHWRRKTQFLEIRRLLVGIILCDEGRFDAVFCGMIGESLMIPEL